MIRLSLLFFMFLCSSLARECMAQDSLNTFRHKTLITSDSYEKWSSVSSPRITNDGRFVSYVIENVPLSKRTIVIKSSTLLWELRFPEASSIIFSEDSKYGFVRLSNNKLIVVELGKSIRKEFSDVESYDILIGIKKEYLIFKSEGKLRSYDFKTNMIKVISSVKTYYLSENHKVLVMLVDSIENGSTFQFIKYFKAEDHMATGVWTRSKSIYSLRIDAVGSKICFLTSDTVDGMASVKCICCQLRPNETIALFDSQSVGIPSDENITYLSRFNKDGSAIFFNTERKEKKELALNSGKSSVRVWSYLDKKLQSLQLKNETTDHSFLYVCNIENKNVRRLTYDGDIISNQSVDDSAMLVLHGDPDADWNERGWNKTAGLRSYLISTVDGSRIFMEGISVNTAGDLSPYGKFVIFSDNHNFFSYEVASGKYRNITANLDVDWSQYFFSDRATCVRGIAGWLKDDAGVLVYDRFDIWLLDPRGKRAAVNITNGYGRKNNIIFGLGLESYVKDGIHMNERIILNAIGLSSKKNGFFSVYLGKREDPELLFYGDYVFSMYNPYAYSQGCMPIKSLNREVYIVGRMSARESLNYFVTSDFKKFLPISDNHPERLYNWYTTELHSWKSLDGKMMQGILYKPENFDSKRKYPIILHYYEKTSFNLNVFIPPTYSGSDINIPTYVSNDYLVFTPDIEYTMGNPMQGTFNSVVSAADYLSTLDFVDSHRMGIQGFSFGGLQTNYLVANTNLFAAACTASGITDMVSSYGSISIDGGSLQNNFQDGGQFRMGGAPWDSTDQYVKNSPIFRANKVSTPLLIMHTTKDAGSPFAQAIEFYTALRSLGKKVWMLEYTDGQHSLRGKSKIDFDIRMRQFFDHYLQRKPAPRWMTGGAPTNLNGIEDGLRLDGGVSTPPDGLLK